MYYTPWFLMACARNATAADPCTTLNGVRNAPKTYPLLKLPKKNTLVLYKSGKWRKSLPQCTMKMVQKWAKIGETGEKNRFSLQQVPPKGHFLKEKAISLRKCTKKKSPSAKKKVQKKIRACGAIPLPPPLGGL